MQSTSGQASTRLAIVVTAIAIVLALVGIVGIAAGAAEDDSDDKIAATDSTTTTAGDSAATTSTVPAVTVSTAPGQATSTTAKGGATATTLAPITATTATVACPAAPAAAADPASTVSAPAVGTYTYASCTDSKDTLDSKIGAGSSGDGVTRRTVTSTTAGYPQTATVAYGPNGVLLESISINSPQGKITCDWKPDVQNYPASLKVGTTWNANSSCDLKQENGSSPGKLTVVANGKVTGKVTVNVAGTTVTAWVIESTVKLTTNVAFGSTSVTVTSLSHYDPAHGLDVYRHSQTQSEAGAATRDEHLVSLTPKS